MKKFNAEIGFVFSELLKGGKDFFVDASGARFIQKAKVKINLDCMPQTEDRVTLLNDTQIDTVFEEEYGELFETRNDVLCAFTFSAVRHRGWMEQTASGVNYSAHTFWVALTVDLGSKHAEDVATTLHFVLSQLVRFGVIDKFRP